MSGAVLTYKKAGDSPAFSVCAYGFKWADLEGATVLDGHPYYIAEAVKRGAVLQATPVKRGRSKKGAA